MNYVTNVALTNDNLVKHGSLHQPVLSASPIWYNNVVN